MLSQLNNNQMNAKQIIYALFPFVLGFIAQQVINIPDTSYWFYVWLLCIVSVFIFVKMILPHQEQKFNAISDIDFKSALDDKTKEQKSYSYIAGLHVSTFFAIIILYFIN